jgi:uncharacterized membrane protein
VIRRSLSARWLFVLLLVSLAVNLFFGGLVVARHVMAPPHPPEPRLPRLVEDLARHLAPADAAILHRVFAAHTAEIEERSANAAQARDRIRQAMSREPFDPAALRASFEDARSKDMDLRRAVQDVLLEAATAVSPDGRGKLAAARPLQR